MWFTTTSLRMSEYWSKKSVRCVYLCTEVEISLKLFFFICQKVKKNMKLWRRKWLIRRFTYTSVRLETSTRQLFILIKNISAFRNYLCLLGSKVTKLFCRIYKNFIELKRNQQQAALIELQEREAIHEPTICQQYHDHAGDAIRKKP
jgi:hypothetical protein